MRLVSLPMEPFPEAMAIALGHQGMSKGVLATKRSFWTLGSMTIRSLERQTPFTTKDGSQIRSILDDANASVQNQSLAEATLTKGQATERHYHKRSEEFYFILDGEGRMEIDGEEAEVRAGDAVLIPPGAWHQIAAASERLRFLCCCAPPYAHEDCYFS